MEDTDFEKEIRAVRKQGFVWGSYTTPVEISHKAADYKKDVILAFDYTEEDFYGDAQGFWIYGWTGENAVTGKFKFLTCAIVNSDIPQKIPLISIPVHVLYASMMRGLARAVNQDYNRTLKELCCLGLYRGHDL